MNLRINLLFLFLFLEKNFYLLLQTHMEERYNLTVSILHMLARPTPPVANRKRLR